MVRKKNKISFLKDEKSHLLRDDNLNHFYADIRRYTPLKVEETKELFLQYKNGTEEESKEAFNKLFVHNIRLVITMARRYCGRHEDINDIIQEGCIGLMKAIEAFDINDGTPFSVYALYWIRRLINEFKIGTSQLVKQRNRPRIVHQASKLRNKMFNELEREPNIEEVHEKFNELNSTSKVSSASDFVDIEYIYIDGFCTPIEDSYQLKVVSEYDRASETHPTCEKKFKEEQDKLMVKNLLDGLTDNETKVIKMYFGIDEPIESNINMISYRLGITPQRVSQICISAMGKMKKKSKKYVHARYC